jgi:ubiquinone/menaquinone biosynthesis C-methylase UbiE
MPTGGATGPGEAAVVWSGMATWYDQLLATGSGPHETAGECLSSLLPPLAGAKVLDLGCGPGHAARAVVKAGAAQATGVDVSPAMVEIAKSRTERDAPINYVVDDATSLASIPDAGFDGLIAQLSLMDIADLGATVLTARRVLKPKGWLVVLIGHPCFLAPHATTLEVDGRPGRAVSLYFEEGFWRSTNPTGVRGKAGNYHRMVSTYINTLLSAGFRIDRLAEPKASPLLATNQPVYSNVPIFLGIAATAV